MLIPPFFGYAQKQTKLGIGATLEKVSEKDLLLPSIEINGEKVINKNFSLSASVSYGQINNGRNNLFSLTAKLTAFYAPFKFYNHKIKVGGGAGYRNISNQFLESWTENGSGKKYNQLYSDRKYSSAGFHVQIEDDWKISNRIILTPNIGYQYLFQDFQSFSVGIRISYCL